MTVDARAQRIAATAAGPLVVSQANPRWFTIASGNTATDRAVYLTGAHIWNNLQDGMGPGGACADSPERFDYPAYLRFLKDRGHSVVNGETKTGAVVKVQKDASISFKSPCAKAGLSVLYLKAS